MSVEMLIKNATVMTGQGNESYSGCVYCRDGVIAYAGDAAGAPDAPDAEVIDAGGDVLMPGFVNAHTHLPMTLLRSAADDLPLHAWLNDRIWPLEARMDGEAVYWGSMLAIAELVRGGVTAVNDQYFFAHDIARAVRDGGIRAVLARGLADSALGGRAMLSEAEEFYHAWHGGADGRIGVALGPHAEYTCSRPFLERIAERAAALGCLLHMHISETQSEHAECVARHGMTPTALLEQVGGLNKNALLAHCVHVDRADMERIAAAGANVLHCPDSNLKLGSGIAPVAAMLEQGINVCVGTDGAASNNDLDLWNEMQKMALLQKGVLRDAAAVGVDAALSAASYNGAKALRLPSGRIQAGAAADLILVDTHQPHYYPRAHMRGNLVYCGKSSDVRMTMVAGRILYKDGVYPLLDIEEIIAKAQECAQNLEPR